MCEWYKLYGDRLTIIERFYMNIPNILETSANFDFNLPADLNDITPCCGKYPKGINSNDSSNEGKLNQFYALHYGPEYRTSRQVQAEQSLEKESSKMSSNSHKSASKLDKTDN
ncbi:unnamed protein product [Bursaphelenchus okinawaensis]|uniref:Uncharacterized protein n=1 Tax=Bursaphelenchus okinawaensis TaxID=465554 RepID=A0A811K1I1_9BILA|nr:unnamed protein product [Bursaphelenchus okinawaensis]CAG9089990.1 unnamed protein product [Bursaphelenchus okinawaensis]